MTLTTEIEDKADAEPDRWHYEKMALMLLDHARHLKEGHKGLNWVGMAEIKRRVALLVSNYWSEQLPVSHTLAHLISFLLCDDDVPMNSKGGLYLNWLAAIHQEAESLILQDGNPYSASVSSVAVAAFGESGDHRKTIRAWRLQHSYLQQVISTRHLFEFRNALQSGASEERLQEICDRIPSISWDLESNLRLSGRLPGESAALNPHLLLNILYGI